MDTRSYKRIKCGLSRSHISDYGNWTHKNLLGKCSRTETDEETEISHYLGVCEIAETELPNLTNYWDFTTELKNVLLPLILEPIG